MNPQLRPLFEESVAAPRLTSERSETPLQQACLSYVQSEQAWINLILPTRCPAQPEIHYDFFESDQLQAIAIERADCPFGFIAVSAFCVVSIGTFFRAAMLRRSLFEEIGDKLIIQDVPADRQQRLATRLADRSRNDIVRILTMMAMRFLTAHEVTHIINGHLRYQMRASGAQRFEMAEAEQEQPAGEALFRQTLEMDADAGAVLLSMPGITVAEWDSKYANTLHEVYRKPELALKMWLFAMCSLFRLLHDASPTFDPERSTDPAPMLRALLVLSTLDEVLRKKKFNRLRGLIPELLNSALVEAERSFADILGSPPDLSGWKDALALRQHGDVITRNWERVRPVLEPYSRAGLAPLPSADKFRSAPEGS
jgi:hypothetical protein